MRQGLLIGWVLALVLSVPGATSQPRTLLNYWAGASGALAEAGFALGSVGTTTYYVRDDSLLAFDYSDGTSSAVPIKDPFAGFATDTKPSATSSALSEDGRTAWLWDGSVGSVIRIDTRSGASRRWELYSSRTQYMHAGGLNPVSGRPVAFSGYGYYRAKDFIVEFVDSLSTWREIPISGPRPEPRMNAVMVFGWHPTKVAMVGGMGVTPGTVPPGYGRSLDDIWVLDLAVGRWSLVGHNPAIACLAADIKGVLGFVPVDHERRRALLLTQDVCRDEGNQVGAIYAWNPELTELELIGNGPDTMPDRGRLAGIFVPSANRISLFHTVPDERPMSSWLRVRTDVDWTPVRRPAPAGRRDVSRGLLVLALLLGTIAVVLLVRRRMARERPVMVRFSGTNGDVVVTVLGEPIAAVVSQHAHLLLEHLASRPTRKGDRVTSEELRSVFDSHYSDSDSARVIRNRALEEVNRLLAVNGNPDALARVRRKDDARRFDYIARFGIEMA